MDFGSALNGLKTGHKLQRSGWNGRGMFIYLVPENRYAPTTNAGAELAGEDGKVPYGAYLAMKTAHGNVVPWLASQTDILADDWELV